MRKSIIASTLVLVSVVASPALLYAQVNPTSANTDNTMVTDRGDDTNWSWIGLLGLAGLLGLKRSNRDKTYDTGRARTAT